MSGWIDWSAWRAWFDGLGIVHVQIVASWLRALLFAGLGVVFAFLGARMAGRAGARIWGPQASLVARRVAFWAIIGLFGTNALRQVGFDLSVLLGAAGVVTVAFGFASQTSASNVISGLFLLAEQPFAVGDYVRLGGSTGEVLSIDLLSVKLRTFDNLFVRVPNEVVMKSEIVNLSRFPIRRFDLQLRVETSMPLAELRERLIDVIDGCQLALDEPRPGVFYTEFTDEGVRVQLSVWALQADYIRLRNEVVEHVQAELSSLGVAVSIPRRRIVERASTERERTTSPEG